MATQIKKGYDLKVLLEVFNIEVQLNHDQAGSFKNDAE